MHYSAPLYFLPKHLTTFLIYSVIQSVRLSMCPHEHRKVLATQLYWNSPSKPHESCWTIFSQCQWQLRGLYRRSPVCDQILPGEEEVRSYMPPWCCHKTIGVVCNWLSECEHEKLLPRTTSLAEAEALSTTVWAVHVYIPAWLSWAFTISRSPMFSFWKGTDRTTERAKQMNQTLC